MKKEFGKWGSFKFRRKTATSKASPDDAPAGSASQSQDRSPEWPDLSRLFSADPWRAMGDFLHEPLANISGLGWFGDFSSSRFHPRIDVVDDGEALRVTVELPGMTRDDVRTTVEDGALVLRGEKKQDVKTEESGCYRLERSYGSFVRTIPLPEGLDLDHIDATFEHGILSLRFPKTDAPSPVVRNIDIS